MHSLQGAEVFLTPANRRVHSDEQGRFRLERLCPGSYVLNVVHHQEEDLQLSLVLRGDTFLNLYMEHEEETLHEVVVHQVRIDGPISGDKLRALSADQGTAGLARIPGVQLLQQGPTISKPVVQGMWGLRVPVYAGGNRLEGQSWGIEHAPEAELQAYGILSVTHGAMSLMLGHDALGGAIRMEQDWSLHPGASYLTLHTALAQNGRGLGQFVDYGGRTLRRPEWQWKTHAGFRRSGNMFAPGYYLWNTGNERLNMLMAARRKGKYTQEWSVSALHTRQGIFSGAHTGNLTDLYAAIARRRPITPDSFSYKLGKPWQQNEHLSASWKMERISKNGLQRWLSLSAQYDRRREFDFNRSSADPRPQLDLRLLSLQLNAARHVLFRDKIFHLGGSQRLQVQEYSRIFLVPAYAGWSGGAWVARSGRWRGWMLDAVLRADAHLIRATWVRNNIPFQDARQFFNLSGGLSLIRRLANNISYEQHLLRQWRNPWLNELYSDGVHRGSGAYERGNRNLRAEHALKWEHRLVCRRPKLYAEWTLFGNLVRNFMNLEPGSRPVLTVRGALPLFEYRQYHALFAGSNLHFRRTIDKVWQLQGRLDAVFARNLDSGRMVPLLPPVQASLGLNRKLGSWTFNINPAYTAKTYGYREGSDFLPPPTGYLLLHADVSLHQKLGAHELTLQLGAHNLGNKSYRDYMNRFRYFADEPGRNIWLRAVLELHRHEPQEQEIQLDQIQIIHKNQ